MWTKERARALAYLSVMHCTPGRLPSSRRCSRWPSAEGGVGWMRVGAAVFLPGCSPGQSWLVNMSLPLSAHRWKSRAWQPVPHVAVRSSMPSGISFIRAFGDGRREAAKRTLSSCRSAIRDCTTRGKGMSIALMGFWWPCRSQASYVVWRRSLQVPDPSSEI